ncbi:MAG: thiamine pyrophosphate-dependent enzyme, partial [Kofleriaceae bacterium]
VVVVDHFPLVAAAAAGDALRPDLVVQIGGEPVAMAWPRLAAGAHRLIIADAGWPDGDSSAAQLLVGSVGDALARLTAQVPTHGDDRWRRAWHQAEVAAGAAMAAARAWPGPWSETDALARVVAGLADGDQLVVGNSLPIRVIDEVAATRADVRVLTQRGAAGIDGLVAGAAGAAWATGRVTTVILGDVSFAHDVGSLAVVPGLPVRIIVLDNRGGHIFDDLPLAAAGVEPATFARLWLTPPALAPVALAAGFGLPARTVRNPDEMAAAADVVVVHAVVAADGARATRTRALATLAAPPAPAPAPSQDAVR